MSQIEVLKQFTLLNQTWVDNFVEKYGTFSAAHFAENLCNQVFNYYNGFFNVLVFNKAVGEPESVRIELTSNPLQHLTVSGLPDDAVYTVYIFKEGFFQIADSVKPWCAYGSYSKTLKDDTYELNFYYITID